MLRSPFCRCRVSNPVTITVVNASTAKTTVCTLYQVACMHGISVELVRPSKMYVLIINTIEVEMAKYMTLNKRWEIET